MPAAAEASTLLVHCSAQSCSEQAQGVHPCTPARRSEAAPSLKAPPSPCSAVTKGPCFSKLPGEHSPALALPEMSAALDTQQKNGRAHKAVLVEKRTHDNTLLAAVPAYNQELEAHYNIER